MILKDDFSGYLWLVTTAETDADTVANALLQWFSSFGTVPQWAPDEESHFSNELVRKMRESMKSQHPVTLWYCP